MASRSSAVVEIRSRDADRTREEILRAAMAEFAGHGFGGARMGAIAERSGVDKKLIYYYFAGKDELFLAVLEQTYADIRAAERELHLEASDPLQAIRSAGRVHLAPLPRAPRVPRPAQQREHAPRRPPASARAGSAQMNSPLIEVLADVLARGEKSGELRSGIDPMQLYISIAGLAYFYLSNNHTLATIFGRELMTPKAHAARLEHMCAVSSATSPRRWRRRRRRGATRSDFAPTTTSGDLDDKPSHPPPRRSRRDPRRRQQRRARRRTGSRRGRST